jgi:hypothetical protein
MPATTDCPHWLPPALNSEPEAVHCIGCGNELPCGSCVGKEQQ